MFSFAVFKVIFSGFLSRKSNKKSNNKQKKSQVFGQSEKHHARFNLRKFQSHLFELVLKVFKGFILILNVFSPKIPVFKVFWQLETSKFYI